jgi:hypothetical protein
VAGGLFVLGMHRSGTSAATRLVGLLGVRTPQGDDLVPATAKNPTGYWESMSLVWFNTRILAAVGADMRCPIRLAPGWEADARLDPLRGEAGDALRGAFPVTPWVWKDPRSCLTFSFWRGVVDFRPPVVLVNRNPLEIAASSLRLGKEESLVYALALWERYLRQALEQVAGLPVLVTDYAELLADPVGWCRRSHAFLGGAGVAVTPSADEEEVLAFVDGGLRHAQIGRAEVLGHPAVSEAQRALFLALEGAAGAHGSFVPPSLPPETPATEALLAERRRVLRAREELGREREHERVSRRWSKVRASPYVAPARRAYASMRRRQHGPA